jgi:hypothetical protein
MRSIQDLQSHIDEYHRLTGVPQQEKVQAESASTTLSAIFKGQNEKLKLKLGDVLNNFTDALNKAMEELDGDLVEIARHGKFGSDVPDETVLWDGVVEWFEGTQLSRPMQGVSLTLQKAASLDKYGSKVK